MRTTILQRAFDINTMEFGFEVGARLRSIGRGKKGAIEKNVTYPISLERHAVSTTSPISTNFAPNVAE